MAFDSLFTVQQSLTILCQQFPLVSTINDSSLLCARLRTDQYDPATLFDFNVPTQVTLLMIVDAPPPAANGSPIDITIGLNQSTDAPSSIDEIRLALLVTQSNFTLNSQRDTVYSSSDVLIVQWLNSSSGTYTIIDTVPMESQNYQADSSLCKWDLRRWHRLFAGNASNAQAYAYVVKTTSPQLIFTVTDPRSPLVTKSPPAPLLSLLYCISYRFGLIELLLTIIFGVLFVAVVITLSVLHYLKNGAENRSRNFERYHHRDTQELAAKQRAKINRQRANQSMSSVELDERLSD